jgi:predicted dehydrogenase
VALARAEAAARRHRVPAAVRTIAELAPLEPDVVHLCVPPDLHAPLARQCLELGFSVLVEKPLALASADVRELEALARARGLVLAVNHNSVFHPAFARLRERLHGGEIGRVEHVDVVLAVPLRQLDARDHSHWMFREPRNIVFEQAVHPFAQLVELIGRPAEVQATVLSTRELEPGRPFHERWSVAARAEGGTAQLSFAFGATFQRSTITVLGSDGTLEADLHRNLLAGERKTLWLDFWDAYLAGARRGAALRHDARAGLLAYLRQTLRLAPREDAFYAGMRGSMRAFHAALRAGAPPPADGERATAVLEWCEATVRELPPPRPRVLQRPESPPPRAGEVVVLGAGGFIGRHTLRALLARELPTTAALRRAGEQASDVERAIQERRLRLARVDLGDPATIAPAVRGARVVVHLATGGGATWPEIERAMVQGTRAVGEACLAERVERLVYVSSIAALYLGPDCGADPIEDDRPTDPRPAARALYARGKIAAEAELLELARARGLRVTIVRPGVVMGADAPFQHSGIGLWVRDNHCVGWGRGATPLPLVLVEDVADALARIAAHPGADLDGRALNLAARVPLTAAELVARFAAHTGRDVHFHPRALALSQTLEIGKWLVKKAGGRRDAFPSYRDLKSRSLAPRLACRTARDVLGWQPCDDAAEFLRRLLGADGTP